MQSLGHSLLLLCLFLAPSCLLAQKQNNQWRFGFGGGVDFNTTPPTFVPGAATATFEGSASVADRNTGQLLFYTDGVTVWNALNQKMSNGTDLLGGDPILLSSSTAAAIVPDPGSTDRYYIVTVDDMATGNSDGVNYSVVDMSLDGGLGDVVPSQKNIPLLPTNSERLEVVPAANCAGYWIIAHDNSSFYSFLLTSEGFQLPAVTSAITPSPTDFGHLRMNRQFTKLVSFKVFGGSIEIYDFDITTGKLSNPISWLVPTLTNVYGLEFSPDGNLLYAADLFRLYQFDLTQPDAAAIAASGIELSANQEASLQLGPDGKIYVNAGTLGVISNPNQPGLGCNYQQNAIANQSGGGGIGLPKWVYIVEEISDLSISAAGDTCQGSPVAFSINPGVGLSSVAWNFGDPGSGAANTSGLANPSHVFSDTGTYEVSCIVTLPCGIDTIRRTLTIFECAGEPGFIDILASTDSCLQGTVSFSLNTNLLVESIIGWDFGDPGSGANNTSVQSEPAHTFSGAGTYTVSCILQINCSEPPSPNDPITTPCFYLDTVFTTVDIVDCNPPAPDCSLYLPNSFSPNGDGINDSFNSFAICDLEEYEVSIFNRWGGQLIFNASDPAGEWDGTSKGRECDPGAYVYLVKYKFQSQEPRIVRGSVLLLR